MKIQGKVRQLGWSLLMSFVVMSGASAALVRRHRFRMASTVTPFTR